MGLEIDILINKIIKRIILGVSEQIQKEDKSSHLEKDKDKDFETKFLSPTEFSRKHNISKPVCYRLINEGILPCYQITGSTKKYLKPEDIKKILIQVPIPSKNESYEEFETRIRKGKKLGDRLWREFKASGNKQTLSQFSLWLFSNNHTKALNNFLIINLDDNE